MLWKVAINIKKNYDSTFVSSEFQKKRRKRENLKKKNLRRNS